MSVLASKVAILALEDGTIFRGQSFGHEGETAGEVVFNTSMTGYQEILTDLSYAGQIVCMTYPQIGNYGVNPEDNESRRPFAEGFIVRDYSKIYSNWRAEGALEDYLQKNRIVGIKDVDTRSLVRRIRVHGAMKGVISSTDLDEKSLINKAKNATGLLGRDLVKGVTCDRPYLWNGQQVSDTITDKRFKVVAFDFGIKLNILRELTERGCEVKVVPAAASAEEVLGDNPDGIFLSNGPGDPKGVFYAVETLRKLLGKVPVFGICLGHQLLALALGGETYKLKFGHRGGNHPVKNLLTEKVEITTQNHGFAVDPTKWGGAKQEGRGTKVLPAFGTVEVTHINLNDGTVEGLRCLDIPAFSVQYHPEASPGPHDSKYLFSNFIDLMSDIK